MKEFKYNQVVYLGKNPDGRRRFAYIGFTKGGRRVVDPTYQVAASLDDIHERGGSGTMTNTTTIRQASSTTETSRYWGGYRWEVAIPKGSTIDSCVWSPYVYSLAYDDANINIHFEKGASPAAFTTDTFNITSRSRTTASVPWIEDSIRLAGENYYDSDSLVTPLKEVVDLYTTTHLVLITRPNDDAEKTFSPYAWDFGDNTWGAKITLAWTEPAVLSRSRGFIIG